MEVEIRSIMERLARERMQVEMRKIGRGATSANRKAAEIRAQRIKYGDLILNAAMLMVTLLTMAVALTSMPSATTLLMATRLAMATIPMHPVVSSLL